MQKNSDINLPILIIGAGIAGIACAKKLQEKGEKVIVLEAKPRIGGRINSKKIKIQNTFFLKNKHLINYEKSLLSYHFSTFPRVRIW